MHVNRRRALAGLVLSILLIVVIAMGQALYQSFQDGNSQSNQKLSLGSDSFNLEVARNQASREQGLGGRDGLGERSGMLFVFDDEQERCMWMKNVRFDLDIIWLDGQKRITQIEPGISPATYPRSFCGDARYVIELPSGTAAEHRLEHGQTLDF